jgi:hypothetical protein
MVYHVGRHRDVDGNRFLAQTGIPHLEERPDEIEFSPV